MPSKPTTYNLELNIPELQALGRMLNQELYNPRLRAGSMAYVLGMRTALTALNTKRGIYDPSS